MALMAAVAAIEGPDERRDAIAAARAGDLAAFELLMRRHERLVLATALRLTGDMEDAKDISQEVFLRLYKNLGRVQAETALPAWLYRVTVNACHDLRRRKPASALEEMPAELVGSGMGSADGSDSGRATARIGNESAPSSGEGTRGAGVTRSGGTFDRGSGAGIGIKLGYGALASFEGAGQGTRFRGAVFFTAEAEAGMKSEDQEFQETLELLREAHREPIAEAHYAAVRARVLSKLAAEPRVWWRMWAYGFAIVAVVALLLGRTPWSARDSPDPLLALIERPTRVSTVDQGARPTVGRRKRLPHHRVTTPAAYQVIGPPAPQPLVVKLVTNDPNVVIYWISGE